MNESLLKEVIEYFQITEEQFFSSSRKKEIVQSRKVYIYISYKCGKRVKDLAFDLTFSHGNISTAIKTMNDEIETNDDVNNLITNLLKKYRNGVQGS